MRYGLLAAVAVGSSLAFVNCGNDNSNSNGAPGTIPNASDIGLGNLGFACPSQSSGLPGAPNQQASQQQKVPFQSQQQQGCDARPPFKFSPSSQVADLDVQLDCDNQQVFVRNKGADQQSTTMNIQSDGKVKGDLQFQQQVPGDSSGNLVCWVEYHVAFDGTASCGSQQQSPGMPGSMPSTAPSTMPSPIASLSPAPGASPSPGPSGDKLSLATQISFAQTTPDKLAAAGIAGAMPGPSPSPSPSVSPSPSPSVSPSPSPSANPSPRLTPVTICVVQNPCPIGSKTDMTCPGQ